MDLSYLSRLGLKAFPLAKQPLSKPIQTLEQFTLDILKEIRKDLKEFKVIPYGGGICVAINRMIEFKISEYLKPLKIVGSLLTCIAISTIPVNWS